MPVVQKGTTETGTAATGQLLEVYARAYGLDDDLNDSPVSQSFRVAAEAVDTSAIKHDWDRVAAPLRPVGLYKVGLQAASSVRKLGLTIPRLALYQQYHRQAYVERQRLHLAARKVTDDWRQSLQSTIEGTSAELGLALALLLSASSARPQCVIATGRLGGQPAGLLEFADVEVLKVNSLPEKLRLVTRLAEQHRLPHSDKSEPLLFFTPTHHDVNGQSVAVSDLPEVTALVRWGVKVIPITRLSEAARLLGAQRARWLPQDGRYWWVVGGGIGLLSLLVSLLFLMPPQNLPLIQPELVIQTPRPDDSSHLIDIAKVPAVSADQRLFLKLSEHPGAYRYLLELDGAGKAEIQDVQALRDAGKFDRESNMITLRLADMPPPTYTLLLLVSSKPLKAKEQQQLAERISALQLKPAINKSGFYYKFEGNSCELREIQYEAGGYGFSAGEEKWQSPPADYLCEPWTRHLLTLLYSYPTVQFQGATFRLQ